MTSADDDPSHKRLIWEPPASLNITDVEPDISGYRICTNLTEVCINTTELEYVFPNLRIPIQFSVTAVNLVGESNASVAFHEPCDPSTGMKITLLSHVFQAEVTIDSKSTEPESIDGSNVRSDISFQTQDNPVVTFSFSTVGLGINIQLSVVLICPCATFNILHLQLVMLFFAHRAHQLEVPTALTYTQSRLPQSLRWRQWFMDH